MWSWYSIAESFHSVWLLFKLHRLSSETIIYGYFRGSSEFIDRTVAAVNSASLQKGKVSNNLHQDMFIKSQMRQAENNKNMELEAKIISNQLELHTLVHMSQICVFVSQRLYITNLTQKDAMSIDLSLFKYQPIYEAELSNKGSVTLRRQCTYF